MKLFIFLFLCMIPSFVYANESSQEWEIVSVNEKYYRVIEHSDFLNSNKMVFSEEITKEEYYNSEINFYALNDTIESNYKKMTVSIATNGSYFRYKVVLNWKSMPKVRSYDIIAIGYNSFVTPKSNSVFSQVYCTSSTSCTTSTSFVEQKYTNGISAIFSLPSSSSIISLTQTYYVDVKKNVDSTVISQVAIGDYSHSVKTISQSNALKFSVNNSNGIILDSTIVDYYDTINYAKATWSGSW